LPGSRRAGYGSIDALARDTVGVSIGNRFLDEGGEPLAVDFSALAGALGCVGVRAGDAPALERALQTARAGDRTTVVHCPVAEAELPASGVFWDLGVPETADDPGARRHIDAALARRRASGQRRFP